MRAMRIAFGMSLLAERKTKKTSGLGITCVRQSIGQVHTRKCRSRPALWQTYVKGAFPTSRGHWGYCTTGDTLPHTLEGKWSHSWILRPIWTHLERATVDLGYFPKFAVTDPLSVVKPWPMASFLSCSLTALIVKQDSYKVPMILLSQPRKACLQR